MCEDDGIDSDGTTLRGKWGGVGWRAGIVATRMVGRRLSATVRAGAGRRVAHGDSWARSTMRYHFI